MPNYSEYDNEKLREELSAMDEHQLKVEQLILLNNIAQSIDLFQQNEYSILEEIKYKIDDIAEAIEKKAK